MCRSFAPNWKKSLVDVYLVDVAPAPIFSGFDGAHDRMPLGVEVSCGMTVLGRIAAPDLAAFQAHAEVDPAVSGLETFFAALGVRLHMLYMILYVRALCCAHTLLFSIRCRHDRQFDKTSMARSVIDTLRGLLIVGRLGPENVRHKRLRVPIV